MVGKTNSQPPLLLFSCQDLFAKIAEATGESLESVCQMQEAERNGLVEVLKLQQVGFGNSLSSAISHLTLYYVGIQEEAIEEQTGSESENKRRRDCSGEKEVCTSMKADPYLQPLLKTSLRVLVSHQSEWLLPDEEATERIEMTMRQGSLC